jgi:peroxiredoxin
MAAFRQHRLLPEGSRAPDFRLDRLDGGQAALPELIANGPVLLAFFKVTCPVCQLTLPYLNRLTIPVYGISQNCEDDTREFNRHFGIAFPTLLDREEDNFPASNAYGIASVPTLFLIERDGTVPGRSRAGSASRSNGSAPYPGWQSFAPRKRSRNGSPVEGREIRLPAGVNARMKGDACRTNSTSWGLPLRSSKG